jgi:hypothetical protein
MTLSTTRVAKTPVDLPYPRGGVEEYQEEHRRGGEQDLHVHADAEPTMNSGASATLGIA